MSLLVVDSCVAVKWVAAEPGSGAADRFLDDCLDRQIELLAPDSIDAEVANGLWAKFHRGNAAPEAIKQAFASFCRIKLTKVPCAQLLDDALQLALEHDRSFYDCLFLALSLRENCPFVTADERLFNAVGRVFPNVRLLAADS